ncbi:hypothetical protein BDA99DRAFT_496613 [Phascolomyces articulosus]|uniref:Uncharacterized protein n=1 Tax=Phascolomyces articulosus TaxID=60185 RepID=A0AAD5KNB2_9FUNG|nr:hypothetical protein BDA99DRAFT_496613 [Phascolomyces articulosus]
MPRILMPIAYYYVILCMYLSVPPSHIRDPVPHNSLFFLFVTIKIFLLSIPLPPKENPLFFKPMNRIVTIL